MIKPPSLVKARTEFYSRDSAFIPYPVDPGDKATEEQRVAYVKALAEHEKKWEAARLTGDYSSLRIEGQDPTGFEVVPLKTNHAAYIVDRIRARTIGINEANLLAFGATVKGVSNFGDIAITVADHPQLGTITTPEFLDKAGFPAGMSLAITNEIGSLAIDRSRDISPSS